MKSDPNIAGTAALIGDPARANMLSALMDGRALTATELAAIGGVSAPTASAHLHKLAAGGLVTTEKQGRHRYYRLSSHDVAATLEALAVIAERAAPTMRRPGPKDAEMRRLRRCYDHLAGDIAIRLVGRWRDDGWLIEEADSFTLTDQGRCGFERFGVDVAGALAKRRGFARRCLDWSERRAHLGGALGAAVMARFVTLDWVRLDDSTRSMAVTDAGRRGLAADFGLVDLG